MGLFDISGRQNCRAIIAGFGAAIVLMSGTSALCADVSDQVQIKVQATIASRCGFATKPTDPTDTANVEATTAIEIPFALDCNMPFSVAVQSTHGALLHEGMTADAGSAETKGFAITKAYNVGLTLGTSAGPHSPADCRSDQLQAGSQSQGCAFFGTQSGQGYASGNDISEGQTSTLTVKWTGANGGPRQLAGNYQDTLTIFVGPTT